MHQVGAEGGTREVVGKGCQVVSSMMIPSVSMMMPYHERLLLHHCFAQHMCKCLQNVLQAAAPQHPRHSLPVLVGLKYHRRQTHMPFHYFHPC